MGVAELSPLAPRVRFCWILSPRKDLVFYIGSALAGWAYLGLILWAVRRLEDPLQDPLATLELGGLAVPLTLELLVIASWALILDAPHVWATLARTLFDPDEWQVRGREIRFSFVWFAVGPAAILTPYLVAALGRPLGLELAPGRLALGAVTFFVFFRLWAYYHVVRQHWGFFQLYKRKADDFGPEVDRIDYWFFNLTFYMPLVMFMTSAFYATTPGFPDLGLRRPLMGEWSIGSLVYPAAWTVYLGVLLVYLAHLWRRWRAGATLNGSKLMYMLPLIPLHFAAFSHPILAVFVVPLVTVGHNIQYHCIVYTYARNKYAAERRPAFNWARRLFSSFWAYAAAGLLFTLIFYKGPVIEWFKGVSSGRLDNGLFNALGMMAGVRDPAALGLGEQVMAALIVGFAMQHYYLDSKIWRVRKDRQVRKYLKVD
jgi:hypothetical protein